jgi:hypothetical protein
MSNPKFQKNEINSVQTMSFIDSNDNNVVCKVIKINGVLKYHCFNGPAKVYKKTVELKTKTKVVTIKEYYIFGVQYSELEYNRNRKIA